MEVRRYRSVDIIKGIAMIMVILVHYAQNYQIGIAKSFKYLQMGCPVFFVASGFGIMCLINAKFGGQLNRKNISKFYFSRFKALAPGWYIAIVFLFIVNTVVLRLSGSTLEFGTNRGMLSIVCNLLFVNGLLPFCNNDVILGAWYIGTTVILYLLTPVILKLMGRLKNAKVFFAVSSIIGMAIWVVLYFLFQDTFTTGYFGYFFFLVHYPEYVLGILLYFDFTQKQFSKAQVKLFLPLSILSLIIAIVLFYVPLPLPMHWGYVLSAWMTALATYFALCFMLSNEKDKEPNWITSTLIKFGRNSYCIYLLHGFFAWTFVRLALIVLNKIGVPVIVSFFALIPITLCLAYFAGLVFKPLVVKVSGLIFNKKGKPADSHDN